MDGNETQIFVIKTVKIFGENCASCVKKHASHYCLTLFACVLYKFFPSVFIVFVYSFPLAGFAFLVHRVFIRMERSKVKSVGVKSKRWKELQSRRSFKPLHRVHVPKQHNKSSFMQDPPSVRQNAKETNTKIYNNIMSAKDNKDAVSSTISHNNLADDDKDNVQESLDVQEDKKKQEEQRNKTVRWLDEAEKSLMDLGVSEDERSKRLEILMERRRSKKNLSFQERKNGMGTGIGNTSCGQIPALIIPKKNPFLADSSSDSESPSPVSAPSYMVKSNPFDLPYDPHEEKPILTGDSFEDDEFRGTHHHKEPMFSRHGPSRLGSFAPPEFTNYKYRMSFRGDFAIKQLPCGKLVTSTVDDKKQSQGDGSNPNHGTNDNHVKKEDKEADNKQSKQDSSTHNDKSSEKVVDIAPDKADRIGKNTKEKEPEHEISIKESSSSSSSCSEDEQIMGRPNKEAILHCLSMSRMRVISLSQGKSFHKHAETFDCGPSEPFDKSKTDCFYFGGNKRVLYASTNSIASDMQVEVSEVGSPPSTSLHERLDSFDMDLNDVRLSDVDDFSDHSSVESGYSRTNHDSEDKNDSYANVEVGSCS